MADTLAFHPPIRVVRLSQGLVAVGAIALAIGLLWVPERAWANVLLVSNYLIGLALGGLLLVALHYVTGARWSAPLRRVSEALAPILPVAGVGLLAVLLFQPTLYPWYEAAPSGENASPLREVWLNRPFFVVRAVVYLGIWLAFAFAILRTSHQQDRTGESVLTARSIKLSAAFLVAFGVTCWLASADWLMSLESEWLPDGTRKAANWTSTVFGVYNFAGLFLSALAAVTLLAILLRQFGPLRNVLTYDHLHDLGTLLFAFSSFWMYIWFCQYLLIWYTNHPAETVYLRHRWEGTWPTITLLDLVLNWGIPFAVLLFRGAKCRPVILGSVCVVLLAGRWVDLFLMIFPTQMAELAIPGVVEAGFVLGAVGIFSLVVLRALSKASLIPLNGPLVPRQSSADLGDQGAPAFRHL